MDPCGPAPPNDTHPARGHGSKTRAELSPPSNPGPTFVSRIDQNVQPVIDLVFLLLDVIASAPMRREDLQGESDHIPLTCKIQFGRKVERMSGRTLKPNPPDAETAFLRDDPGAPGLYDTHPMTDKDGIDAMSEAIAGVFDREMTDHSEEFTLTPRSKRRWNESARHRTDEYKEDPPPDTRRTFRSHSKPA